MSKNIIIQEGGTGKQATVNKLRTNLVGGGSTLWVPEDETQLTTLRVTEDGTYRASDEGYYGYSEVTVSGIGAVTGRDEDGNETYVTTDESGDLVFEKVPSSIVITTDPNTMALTQVYLIGETMDYSVITVKAYYEDGSEWGDVPFEELIFPVKKAGDFPDEDEHEYDPDDMRYTINIADLPSRWGVEPKNLPITYFEPPTEFYDKSNQYLYELETDADVACVFAGDDFCYLYASHPFNYTLYRTGVSSGNRELYSSRSESTVYYTAKDNTPYYRYPFTSGLNPDVERAGWPLNRHTKGNVELTATVYYDGYSADTPIVDGKQTIPVRWERPGDFETLEVTYEATVSS